jgi:iron complex outermembrane recepter protein
MRSAFKLSLSNGVSLAAIAASLLLASVPASAQEAMETVVVTGIRASLQSAMDIKRDASQVMDAISAEDIGKFPDKDMGEALQRVTGVQITRSSGGEGATVTIRGGEANMTRVEVNGTGALSVSVGAGDRAIDFRDLPVEFVSRLEVIKSPTADMVEGGIGGTVRVISRRPFDSAEPYIAGSAQTINSNLAQTWDPKFALIASKLFFNDTVGVLVSGTYEQSHQYDGQALTTGWLRQANAVGARGRPANMCGSFFGPSAPATCGPGYRDYNNALQGNWFPEIPRYFNNRRNTLRYAVNSVVEFRPTDDFKAFWDVTFARGYENVRNQAMQLSGGAGVFDYAHTTLGDDNTVNHIELTSNGATVGASCATVNTNVGCLPLDLTFRNILGYLTRQQLTTAVGFSDNLSDELTLDARVDYARSRVDNQETDSTATQYGITRAIVDYTGSEHAPDIQFPGTDLLHGSGVNNIDAYYVPVSDTSREVTSRANLLYKPAWASWLQLKAGFMRHDFAIKQEAWGHRTTLTCRGTPSAGNNVVVVVPCSTITNILNSTAGTNPIPFYNTGNLGFDDEARTWIDQNQDTVLATIAAAAAAGHPTANIYNMSAVNPNVDTQSSFRTWLSNWTIGEGTTDWYGQANFDFPDFYLPVSGNFGVRYVDTNTTTTGYTQITVLGNNPPVRTTTCPTTANCKQYPLATITGGYSQTLPSANLKVELVPIEDLITGQLFARIAYGKVMSRPQPSQIAIGRTLDVVGHTGKQGNPGLLPYLSTDYNAGLEWYFSKINMISVGFFQKNISRFIQTTTSMIDIDGNGNPYLVTYPINNTIPVRIQGIEAGVQYALDWLPKPFDGFGFTANMTSQWDKGFSTVNALDGESLSFPGLSKMAENASVYYENDDVSVRLSYVWRSKWLITATGRGNLPEFNDSYGELDASASYHITPNLTVFADAINLTDSQLVQRNSAARPILFDTFGSRLFFGVRAKY